MNKLDSSNRFNQFFGGEHCVGKKGIFLFLNEGEICNLGLTSKFFRSKVDCFLLGILNSKGIQINQKIGSTRSLKVYMNTYCYYFINLGVLSFSNGVWLKVHSAFKKLDIIQLKKRVDEDLIQKGPNFLSELLLNAIERLRLCREGGVGYGICQRDYVIINVLIDAGAKVSSSIHMRQINADIPPLTVTKLIKAGLRPTPNLLRMAFHNNYSSEIILALIEGGAKVDPDMLDKAIYKNYSPAVILALIKAGVRPDLKTLERAMRYSSTEVVLALIQADVKLSSEIVEKAIFYECSPEILLALIKAKAVFPPDALDIAIIYGCSLETLSTLIKAGAKASQKTIEDAIAGGYSKDCIEVLVQSNPKEVQYRSAIMVHECFENEAQHKSRWMSSSLKKEI